MPFIAFLLNLSLAGIALLRNPGSRLNRVFAYFVSALAVWNFGVFMLRLSTDEAAAYFWQVLIHVGVIALPALYYHFVLIFLDATVLHRRSLLLAYMTSLVFTAINLSGSSLFMRGATSTYWGWAPATGPLYVPFFVYFNALVLYGIVQLLRSYRTIDTSFRRNRARLVLLGTFISLLGGAVDVLRFVLVRFYPEADQIYPIGIPANMFFALMLGTSIVRYRLFDVDVAVKKTAVYGGVGVALTAILALVTLALEHYFVLEAKSAVWVAIPLGILVTMLMSPLGQRLEMRIERLMFSRRQGCYETLLALSKRMSAILNFDQLVDTLVQGLVRGIPLTHCVLMTRDEQAQAFVPSRRETALDAPLPVTPMPADSPIVRWLTTEEELLVKEEARLNPRLAGYFETAEADLEQVTASLIVPLKIENKLIAILLVGEKLSGEIFDHQELELLSLLANQAAIALENATLYEQVRQHAGELEAKVELRTRELQAANSRLQTTSRHKSEFLANMSHELRTPLNAIIGFTRLVMRRSKDVLAQKQYENLEKILVSGEHLLGLINDILDLSKIEAGRMEVRSVPFELEAMIDACLRTVEPMIRSERVQLVKEIEVDLPPLRTDQDKLKQILINLLSNAIKFTEEGKITVSAHLRDGQIAIAVADTGIGIPAEALELIFAEFRQLDSGSTRRYPGTGLGLSISRHFARLLGGDIGVTSTVGVGSTFTVTLPLRLAPGPVAVPTVEEPSPPARRGELVLAIDDDPDVIYLLRENLTEAGYRVIGALSGDEGLRKARELRPFAITLDILMPDRDGWDILRDLKTDPATQNIPIIVISIVDHKDLGFRLGAFDYLLKPFDRDGVLDALDRITSPHGHLLVVDDDPQVADLVRQLLEGEPYEIVSAADGQEALEAIGRRRPDVILLDLLMPRMDGFALIEHFQQDPDLQRIPVIVLTAKTLTAAEHAALEQSVLKVIYKTGLDRDSLIHGVRGALQSYRAAAPRGGT